MIVTYFNRKTGEAFVGQNTKLINELFESGQRNRTDFEMATTSGFVQIKKEPGGRFNVTTVDDPSVI